MIMIVMSLVGTRLYWFYITAEMSIRSLTKVPKLCLVYFGVDKSTCIVPAKKLKTKDNGEPFTEIMPQRRAAVTLRNNGKLLDAMVMANADLLFNPPSNVKKRSENTSLLPQVQPKE